MITLREVYQDGADFYALDELNDNQGGNVHVISAPKGTVKHDYDMDGAKSARKWFLDEWCAINEVTAVWEGAA